MTRPTLYALICSGVTLCPMSLRAQAFPGAARPTATLTRDLRIDANTADLSAVTWLAVSRNGTIAVGQAQDHLIRFFDSAGRSLGTFGRDGAGPGEFRRLDRAGWIGDTLWVTDDALSRYTLISPDRKLLRNSPVATGVKSRTDTSGDAMVIGSAALYWDGSQLMEIILPSTAALRPAWAHDDQHTDSRLVLVLVSSTGEFKTQTAFSPHDQCGQAMLDAYRFCGHPKYGADPTSQYLAWGIGSVAGADSGKYRITLFRPDGRTVFSRQYRFVAQPIPAPLLDSIADLARKSHPRAIPDNMKPTIDPPRVYPPLESVMVESDGTTWVGLRRVDAGSPWVVLSPRGDVIGMLIAPDDVKLMVAGADVVWGTETDPDGLESVVRFRVAGLRRK
ncbi:MAG: hypothetical protein ACREL5_12080 [Gemmatimonadales bacterium]